MEGPGTDEAGGKTPRRGRRVIEQTPPITRKAAADQVGKSECGAGKGLGPSVHLSIKNTGSEIILLIDILSSSVRVSWKSGRDGGHYQKVSAEDPTHTPPGPGRNCR